MEWSQPEPRRRAVCAEEGRAREVPQVGGVQKIMSESQNLDIELLILLKFDFV